MDGGASTEILSVGEAKGQGRSKARKCRKKGRHVIDGREVQKQRAREGGQGRRTPEQGTGARTTGDRAGGKGGKIWGTNWYNWVCYA